MLLPVVLVFSIILVSGITMYSQVFLVIDIYERELAKRFIADYTAQTCLTTLAGNFAHDPYILFDNGPLYMSPSLGGETNAYEHNCIYTLSRTLSTSTVVIEVSITVPEPTLRTHQGKIKFKDLEIEEILMRN